MGEKIPEDCPIRDILRQVELVLKLLDRILDHCKKCLSKEE